MVSTIINYVAYSTSNVQFDSHIFASGSLWHDRLGHPRFKIVIYVFSSLRLHSKPNSLVEVCEACQMRKYHKLPMLHRKDKLYMFLNTLICSFKGNMGFTLKKIQSNEGGNFNALEKLLFHGGFEERVSYLYTYPKSGVVKKKTVMLWKQVYLCLLE